MDQPLFAASFAVVVALAGVSACSGERASTTATSTPVSQATPATTEPATPVIAPKPKPPTEIVWSSASFEAALAQAKTENKLVFVDFWTTWCGWCKKLDHDTFPDANVVRALNERCVCVSIDAESKSGRPVAQRYQVGTYPTLLFVAPDGNVRHKIAGYVPPDRFLAEMKHLPPAK